MKASKLTYFIALIVLLVITRMALMLGFLLPGKKPFDDQMRFSSILFLFTLGFLVISWFPENRKVKRAFENGSLVVGAFFFRAFTCSDISEFVPVWVHLLFVCSFGLFLYFKILAYFGRNKNEYE